MDRRCAWPLAICLLGLALPALAQDTPPAGEGEKKPEPPAAAKKKQLPALPRTKNARRIRSLVADLGSPKWATREAAREGLLEIGREALPWLERAAKDTDAERNANAKELLTTMRWLVPDPLRQIVGEALDGFHTLGVQQRLTALRAFLVRPHESRIGIPWLLTVARFDPDPDVRQSAVRVYLSISPGANPANDQPALDAIADEKPTAVVLYMRAQLLQRLEKLDEAMAAGEAALNAAPSSPPVQTLLVDLYLEANLPKKALPLAKAAVEKNPKALIPRIRLGEALVRAGQRDEGLAFLASIMGSLQKRDPEPDGGGGPPGQPGQPPSAELPSLDVLLQLGKAYLRCGEPDEAVAVYSKALGKFPFNRQLNVAMGDVLHAQGKVDEAVQVYLSEIRYVAIDPPSPEYLALRKRLGQVLSEGGAGWLSEEDAFFKDAFRGRPVVEARRAVAAWLAGRGLLAEAAEEARAVTALAPAAPRAWLELGDILRDGAEFDGAEGAYKKALALDPKAIKPQAQLNDLQVLRQQEKRSAPARVAGGFALWETRLEPADLSGAPESVGGLPPPPLVVGETVVVPVPGSVALIGLSKDEGQVRWQFTPEPPAPLAGEALEQIGLEPVSLTVVSPGVVAAQNPRRARSPQPLLAAIYNVFWRPLHRSWKKARFRGLYAYLIEPGDGASIARIELKQGAQLLPPAGRGRRGRVLVYSARRPKRLDIELVDLVLRRPLWHTTLPRKVSPGRPLFADDRVLVGWKQGVRAFDLSGKEAWTHRRVNTSPEAADGAPVGPAPLTTELTVQNGGALAGTADGRLLRFNLADGSMTELFRLGERRLVGELALSEWAPEGGDVFVSERGGKIHAVRLPADGEGEASLHWTCNAPKAASRSLAWAGERLFALNGSAEDFFNDESALLLALDPATGTILFQRPVVRPASMVSDGGLVLVASGSAISRGGLRVLGAHPEEQVDEAAAELLELRSAASDALAEGQREVAAIVARKYVRKVGTVEILGDDGLEFLAKVLARSNRREEALDVIHLGEERAGVVRLGQGRWEKLRETLGLVEEQEPEEPADDGGAKPPADGDAPGKPPAEKKPDQKKPDEKKPDEKPEQDF